MGNKASSKYSEVNQSGESLSAPPNAQIDAEPEEDYIDGPICLAECTGLTIVIVSCLLLLSGFGLWTVHPPAEELLCTVKTLGLQNATANEQSAGTSSCHLLYTAAFSICKGLSTPLIIGGFIALAAGTSSLRGACLKHRDLTPYHFSWALCYETAGFLVTVCCLPLFTPLAATVAAAMAPINAYWITLAAVHVGMTVANYSAGGENNHTTEDDNMRVAAETYNVVYLGYCAGARLELCLFVATVMLNVLVVLYICDFCRNVGSSPNRVLEKICFCEAFGKCRPNYEKMLPGSQLLKWCHKRRAQIRERADRPAEH